MLAICVTYANGVRLHGSQKKVLGVVIVIYSVNGKNCDSDTSFVMLRRINCMTRGPKFH